MPLLLLARISSTSPRRGLRRNYFPGLMAITGGYAYLTSEDGRSSDFSPDGTPDQDPTFGGDHPNSHATARWICSKWQEIVQLKWLQVAPPNSSIEVGFLVLVPRMLIHHDQELEPTSVPSATSSDSSPVAASTTFRRYWF